jgi:hypothetical protein
MVKREIEIHLDPSELAELFCAMCGDEQAEFFEHAGRIANDWPVPGGWCGQSYDIVKHLGPTGRATIATLAAHLEPEPTAPSGWIDWHGGECPVLDCVRVDVKLRDGRLEENSFPGSWCWHHVPHPSRAAPEGDIVAYRVCDA